MDVLIIGSGKSATLVNEIDLSLFTVVTVNHAHLATDKWTYWISSDDYDDYPTISPQRIGRHQKAIRAEYEPIVNYYGGYGVVGRSIVLCSSYWVLHELKPKRIFYLGCDMNYKPDEGGNTNFYGVGLDVKNNGISDPDKMIKIWGGKDPNYLHNIFMRFYDIATSEGVEVYNLSNDPDTRLPYPRYELQNLINKK